MQVESMSVGSYGELVSEIARIVVSEKANSPLRPLVVVVPSNRIGVGLRRDLVRAVAGQSTYGGIINVAFHTPIEVARLLGGSDGRELRTPDPLSVVMAVRRGFVPTKAGEAELVFHRGSWGEILRSYQRYRSHGAAHALGVEPFDTTGIVPRSSLAKGASTLSEMGLFDAMSLVTEAEKSLRLRRPEETYIVVYLQDVGIVEGRMLSLLAEATQCQWITMSYGSVWIDQQLSQASKRLVSVGSGNSSEKTESDLPLHGVPKSIELRSFSDAEVEVSAAVSTVADFLTRYPHSTRVGIGYPRSAIYGAMLTKALATSEFCFNGPNPHPISQGVLWRLVMGLVSFRKDGFSRRSFVEAFGGLWVTDREGRIETELFDGLTRSLMFRSGLSELKGLLKPEPTEIASPPHRYPREAWFGRAREHLERFLALSEQILDGLDRCASWAGVSEWFETVMALCPKLSSDSIEGRDHDDREVLRRFFSGLAVLDDLGYDFEVELLSDALLDFGDGSRGTVGQVGLGIDIATIPELVGQPYDLLVLVGLGDSMFPGHIGISERPLINGSPALSCGRGDQLAQMHLEMLARSAREVKFSFPRGDLGGGGSDVVASRFLEPLLVQLGRDGTKVTVTESPSELFELSSLAIPASLGVRHSAELLNGPVAFGPKATDRDDETSAQQRLLLAIRSHLGRESPNSVAFDGCLELPGPLHLGTATRAISPSFLERFFTCPYGVFLRDFLGVQEPRTPEDLMVMGAWVYGEVIHGAIDDALTIMARQGDDEPSIDMVALEQTALDCASRRYREQCLLGNGGISSLWGAQLLHLQGEVRRLVGKVGEVVEAYPRARHLSEVPFGFDTSCELALLNGERIRVRGRIDYVCEDGGTPVLVADFKTGSSQSYKKVSVDDPQGGSGKYQLGVYVGALQQLYGLDSSVEVQAQYWFTKQSEKSSMVGYLSTSQTQAKFLAEVSLLVEVAREAKFLPQPHQDRDHCAYCRPLGIDRRMTPWRATDKTSSDKMASYVRYFDHAREGVGK